MTPASTARILVVGAGPVGVVGALACARQGFDVTLIEAEAQIDRNPRAATTHPSTLEMIASVGLIDRFVREGLVARYFEFRDRPTRTLVARFDHERLAGETAYPFVVQTEQHKLSLMGIDALRGMTNATVRMATRLVTLRQDQDRVTVGLESGGAGEEATFDYVVACDGGRSTVRKILEVPFEGYTWPERFTVLTTSFDFEAGLGCCYRAYLADPAEWTNLFKVSGDDFKGRWRAVFPTRVDETDEEALGDAAVQARLQRVLPRDAPYEILHRNIYNVHQRVAAQFRKGRVFLAGDAAHVNNPIGGLGLNSGIHDVMELVEELVQVELQGADPALLDRYDRRRRPLNVEFVQAQTIANKQRLEEADPAQRQRRFDELRAMQDDPARHKAWLMRTSLIESARKARAID
jgi:3-(3-hydroxy-phenyl)propionate hydroxylase